MNVTHLNNSRSAQVDYGLIFDFLDRFAIEKTGFRKLPEPSGLSIHSFIQN